LKGLAKVPFSPNGDENGRDEPWFKADVLFLLTALEQGMSVAHVAGFLRRTEHEVREKAKELNYAVSDGMVAPLARQYVEEAISEIQKIGTVAAFEGCGLLVNRINAELLTTKPNHLGNALTLIVQGALERAAAILRKM
jgi:hypothetical protein